MCIFHMANFRLFIGYPHRNHVDSVLNPWLTISRHPDKGRAPELLQLVEVDGTDRAAKVEVAASLYFDKSDRPAALDHQIQVSMPIPETVLQDPPAALPEPLRGDPLAEEAEGLGLSEHAGTVRSAGASSIIRV
jgi:hypothetical protein